jgi:Na+/glutamate symporter
LKVQALTDLVLDFILSPVLWLSILLGAIYAVMFTFWRGGWRYVWRDVVAGVAGFGFGQLFATLVGLPTVRVGEVHLLWGSLAAVLFLALGRRIWAGGSAASKPGARGRR